MFHLSRLALVLNMIGGALELRANNQRKTELTAVEKALFIEAVREVLSFFGLSVEDLKPQQ
jgi:hypothetical protein